MQTFTAIIEADPDTKLYVGYVPSFPGAHSQGETLDKLRENLREVIELYFLNTVSVGAGFCVDRRSLIAPKYF
jgi:predicted RNase H-like HicB family nuclease